MKQKYKENRNSKNLGMLFCVIYAGTSYIIYTKNIKISYQQSLVTSKKPLTDINFVNKQIKGHSAMFR